jgi:methylamine dehydrogenase accessory protein MauD
MSPLAISNLLLWILVAVLALIVLALTRQLGVLHERLGPVGALTLAKGLKIGERAPALTVDDLTGKPLTIGGNRTDGRSQLVVFLSPSCPVCKTLLPALKSSLKTERGHIDLVLASDGDLSEQRSFVESEGLSDFRYVVSAPLGISYQVGRLPYAALLDDEGVLRARGLVNSREHLESLLEAQRLGVASIQEFMARTDRQAT